MTTYHVRFADGRYLGENDRIVALVQNAYIFSRSGAIHQSAQLNSSGADSFPVRLDKNGKVTNVNSYPKQ